MRYKSVQEYKKILKTNKELDKLFGSYFVKRFAVNLLSLFIPVYLYTLGYDVTFIFLFYVLINVSVVVLAYPVGLLIERIGAVNGLSISFPFQFLFYFFLSSLPPEPLLLLLLTLFAGVGNTFSTISTHQLFFMDVDDKQEGKEVSLFSSLNVLVGLIAPFIGGIVADNSFSSLFLIGGLTYFAAVIPLFFMQDVPKKKTKNLKEKIVKNLYINKKTLSLTGYAIGKEINIIVWPIFLLTIVGTSTNIGITMTIAGVASLLVTYITGTIIDKYKDRSFKFFKITNYLYTASYVARVFSFNQITATITEALRSILYQPLFVFWDTEMVKHGKHTETYPFIIGREIIFNLSRAIIIPFFIALYLIFQNLYILLAVAGLFTLLYNQFQHETTKDTALKH